MRLASIALAFRIDIGSAPYFRWVRDLSMNARFRRDGRILAFSSSCHMTPAEFDGYFGGTATNAGQQEPASR